MRLPVGFASISSPDRSFEQRDAILAVVAAKIRARKFETK